MLTGGGTGGHITPILAVAHELKRLRPDIRLVYIGERHGKFGHLLKDNPDIDAFYTIFAGKFRRYHGESVLKRLFALQDHLLNLRDAVFVLVGIIQSYRLLGKLKPDVLFQKGGYVGMPVGLAAAARKVPFVTHDSDILPGLANRAVSRWAKFNATGMPAEYYPYPEARTRHVGVLVSKDYKEVEPSLQKQYRIDLGLPATAKVLFVTGGSQGSRVINLAMVQIAANLLAKHHDLHIIHQVGKGSVRVYGDYANARLQVLEFLDGMHRYSGAADMIVTRAGANTLAEFGVQGRACLVIPNPLLTGGHQLKNTEYLLQKDAIVAVKEKDLAKDAAALANAIEDLLQDKAKRDALGAKLQAITIPDATHRLALLLLEAAG